MHLHNACKNILAQLTDLLAQLKDDDFRKPCPTLNNATIGQHLRHTLEFFLCLEKGIQTGVVNYDTRDHDQAIETEKIIAREVLLRIGNSLCARTDDTPLTLKVSYHLNAELATTIPSSFHRELVYNIEHAVHHMAIMKIGIREITPYVVLPNDFGIAASTIRHLKKVGISE